MKLFKRLQCPSNHKGLKLMNGLGYRSIHQEFNPKKEFSKDKLKQVESKPELTKRDQILENLKSKQPRFFDAWLNTMHEKRKVLEERAIAEKRVTPELQRKVDDFFSHESLLKKREKLLQEFFQEGHFDAAKEVARKGAKLWEAPNKMRSVQTSPIIPSFPGTLFDGTETTVMKIVGKHKATLIVMYFNEFGEKQTKSFREPFWKEFERDNNVTLLELNVIEQVAKAKLISWIIPYIKWQLGKERCSRYMMIQKDLMNERRQLGIHNKALGWVLLVDSKGHVRWHAHGEATPGELESLRKFTMRLKTGVQTKQEDV